jgi:catechol 2,3-dioxygenase-like lactoylglutathione lyase family enzyme
MIDHIGFPVSDYVRSKAFYLKALAPLDYTLVMEVTQEQTGHDPAVGFGANGKPDFWIGGEGGLDKPLHVAILTKDRATVDAFYKAAIAAGGQWRSRNSRALSSELLRRVRARSRWPQHRSRLPHASVTPRQVPLDAWPGTSRPRHRYRPMPIEPPEIPPATPGLPTEPLREEPPGNPRPEVPPPVREPGQPPQPQELPGKMPDELPVRGPNGPRTPNPATDHETK